MNEKPLLQHAGRSRLTLRERVVHWIAGVSLAYLILTGLSFWSAWLTWIQRMLGGDTPTHEFHFLGGILLSLALVWMWRTLRGEMSLRVATSHERFRPVQKYVFWGFVLCGAALLLSGIVLWYSGWIPYSMRVVRSAAAALHRAATVVIIALLMAHVYLDAAAD